MKWNSKRTRKIYARAHAKKRAAERFNVTLTRQDMAAIKQSVKGHTATHIIAISHSKKVKYLLYKGTPLYFVWNRVCKEIVTFLTKEMVDSLIAKQAAVLSGDTASDLDESCYINNPSKIFLGGK
jgi:hypothetical protein